MEEQGGKGKAMAFPFPPYISRPAIDGGISTEKKQGKAYRE